MATVSSLSVLNVSANPITVSGETIAAYEVGTVTLTGTLGSNASEFNDVLSLVRQGSAVIVAAS